MATALAERIKKTVRQPWTIMEVCGGQTHAIVRFELLSVIVPILSRPRYLVARFLIPHRLSLTVPLQL